MMGLAQIHTPLSNRQLVVVAFLVFVCVLLKCTICPFNCEHIEIMDKKCLWKHLRGEFRRSRQEPRSTKRSKDKCQPLACRFHFHFFFIFILFATQMLECERPPKQAWVTWLFFPHILEIPSKQFGQTQAFDPTPPHPKWSSPPNNQKMPNARTVYALLPCARITERPGNLGRALKDAPALPLWCFKNYLVPKEQKQKRNTFTKNQTLTAKGRSTLHIMPMVKEKKQKKTEIIVVCHSKAQTHDLKYGGVCLLPPWWGCEWVLQTKKNINKNWSKY